MLKNNWNECNMEETKIYTEEEIQKILSERDEYLDGWKRAKADLSNREKDAAREREYWLAVVRANLVRKLLPVVDTLEQTCNAVGETDEVGKGVRATLKQFLGVLKELGVEKIAAVGEQYNPEFHEVVLTESSDKVEDTILKEVQSGYLLDGKVVRVAQVIISKKV